MHHLHFNPLAILVSAVFLWLLGAFWYSPLLFAEPWIAMVGRRMGEKPKGVVHGMIASLIGDLLVAFILAHFVSWSGGDGLWLGRVHRLHCLGRLRVGAAVSAAHL